MFTLYIPLRIFIPTTRAAYLQLTHQQRPQKHLSILRRFRIHHMASSILPRRPLLHRSQLPRLLKSRRAISSEINPLSHGVSRAVASAGGKLVFGVEDIPDFGGVGAEEDAGA